MSDKLITIVAPTYGHMPHKLPAFVHSILGQSFQRMKAIILHDGPSEDGTREFMTEIAAKYPDVIRYVETSQRQHFPEQQSGWGHYLRAMGQDMVDTPWIWHQNADNQLIFAAIEHLMWVMEDKLEDGSPKWDLGYFPIIHSYFGYTPFMHWLAFSQCDLAQIIVRTEVSKKAGFNHRTFAADGHWIEDIKATHPNLRVTHLNATLVNTGGDFKGQIIPTIHQ